MTLRYVQGYLMNFAVMFGICFGTCTGILLTFYSLVPFIMWDFALFYEQSWLLLMFFLIRVIVVISVIVAIWYCLDANTKRLIEKYAKEGNKK